MSGRGWLALLVALAIGSPAAAWAERAELPAPVEVRGRIEDEAGKPVAGADIVVTRADGSARRAAISDADGRFSVATGAAGELRVMVIGGRGARVVTTSMNLAPGEVATLRVRDHKSGDALDIVSAGSTAFPRRTLTSAVDRAGAPLLSRQGDVAGALAALPPAGPATVPAGGPVLAGLPLAEVPVTFEGFSLSDPVDGEVPTVPLALMGAVAVDAGAAPAVDLRAPVALRTEGTLAAGFALATDARGADYLARPSGDTGGWDGVGRVALVRPGARATLAFAPQAHVWEADPHSPRAARGRKQQVWPALAWGEAERAGWHFRGGALLIANARRYGRGGHVLTPDDPVDDRDHTRRALLLAAAAERPFGRGDLVTLSVGMLKSDRSETLAGFSTHDFDGLGAGVTAAVQLAGTLAGEHRTSLSAGLDFATGARTGRFASRQPGLLLGSASAESFRPVVTIGERYTPSLHLEVEASLQMAYASLSGSSEGEPGTAKLSRSFGTGILFAPHARATVRPLVGARTLALHLVARRTPAKLTLTPLMDATNGPRSTLALPAHDALALATELTSARWRFGLLGQVRRDVNVVEDRFAPATGQPELFAPSGAQRDLRSVTVDGEVRFSSVRVGAAAVWARLFGNHSGAIDEATGRLRPWSTPAFDGADVESNRTGRLPYDRPYGLRGYVVGRLVAGSGWSFSGLLRGQLDAGTPLSATGRSAASGDGQVFLVPRGTVGRTRTHTSFDLALKAARKLGAREGWLAFEVFGLAWRRPVTVRDPRFTDAIATPVNASALDPGPGYGRALAYAEPLCLKLRLGVDF